MCMYPIRSKITARFDLNCVETVNKFNHVSLKYKDIYILEQYK